MSVVNYSSNTKHMYIKVIFVKKTWFVKVFNKYNLWLTDILLVTKYVLLQTYQAKTYGPRQANLILIAYASSEGSGEPAHPRSLARTFAARSYKQ